MAARVATEALPARIRHRFPILERLVYVNSCSQGALSDSVRAAYEGLIMDLTRASRKDDEAHGAAVREL